MFCPHVVAGHPLVSSCHAGSGPRVHSSHDLCPRPLTLPRGSWLALISACHLPQHLDAALLELDCLVQRHSDVAVLEACAQAYGSYCDEGGPAHCQAVPACSRLVDMLVDMLTPLLDAFMQQEVCGCGGGAVGRVDVL